ncbi:MAG: glycosyltransferase family 4 protein [Caldilineaceae bacterium]
MSTKKVLIVNAFGYKGGDINMLLLGLPYIVQNGYSIQCVSIPRGAVYEEFCALPATQVEAMELGGKELHPPSRLGAFGRMTEASLTVPRIAAMARRQKVDVIYSLDRTVAMHISYLVSLLTGLPLVLNAQHTHYLTHSAIHRRVASHATRVTMSSNNMRASFLPYVQDPAKLAVIPNAIKIDRYNPNLSGVPIRVELGTPLDVPVVLLAGRMDPYKGQDELIRAAKIILEQRSDVYFWLAGAENVPGYEQKLADLIQELGVGHRVKLIGYRSDLPDVIAGATVCTMPSHAEPFGLVALEALTMGKPVVATAAGGVPEFLVDGEMGYLIEARNHCALADRILSLVNNPEQAHSMGEKGRRQVVENFNEQLYGQRIANVLTEAIAAKGR